ncbi:MAG: hypothetical protein M0Z88_02925 [Actinomycetota bacterium]|nr:hypothetical protein [Actinomycetota bacterium]
MAIMGLRVLGRSAMIAGALLMGVGAASCGSQSSQAAITTTTHVKTSKAPPTTSTTLPDPGLAPQTAALPSTSDPAFQARMRDLFNGIAYDSIGIALKSYLTLDSYLTIKNLSNNGYDYAHRLLFEFALDVEAAHALIASQGSSATYVGIQVPTSYIHWINPGGCYNKEGYWNVPGSRLLYKVGGTLHSIGVASLISYRGEWYVVHLGAESRAVRVGIVDNPAIGAGTPGPPGGC